MNLYIVRHGQTDYNLNHIIQGKSNTKLNENGINQAKKLKEEIDKLNIDLVICSPLIRTKETANILMQDRSVKTIYDERILERGFGSIEGKSDKEYDAIKQWDYKLNYDYKGIEKIQDLFLRTKLFLDDIKKKIS